jgi:hypothetical protein
MANKDALDRYDNAVALRSMLQEQAKSSNAVMNAASDHIHSADKLIKTGTNFVPLRWDEKPG